MRIVLFSAFTGTGINEVVDYMRALGHEMPLLVTTQGKPESLTAKHIRQFEERMYRLDRSIQTLVVDRLDGLEEVLYEVAPDMILTMDFPFLLPQSLLSVPHLGAVNIHPALLPKYRGSNPLGWQILNAEPYMGLTFHRIDAGCNTGAILLQDRSPIGIHDDTLTLASRIPQMVTHRLAEVLRLVEACHPGFQQNERGAGYAPAFTENERIIDWTRSAEEIHRLIRATADEGAIAHFRRSAYRVWESSLLNKYTATALKFILGQPIYGEDGTMIVTTGQGAIQLTRFAQLEIETPHQHPTAA